MEAVPAPELERLFAEHSQAVYGFLVYRVGDATVAEDLLGDTFERVVRSRRRFDARKGSEQAWIYTIALNCLRDHLRRRKAEGEALERLSADGARSQDDVADRLHEHDALFRHLDQLHPREREVIALRYGADLRLEDIATVTGKRLSTVRGRLYSALERLRAALDEEEASPPRPPSRQR
jgi:RNA polymerase sigma-70 factor (ECF subfamily)